jgi:leucyl aminopeptidase (aminopeptidase T)
MKDKRNEILARLLIDYSVKLQAGEILYLEIKGKEALELGKQVIRIATEKRATQPVMTSSRNRPSCTWS